MQCEVNGETWACDVAGEGEALLLVHGLGGTANSWAPVSAAFANRFRIVTPDLPGAGRTAHGAALSVPGLAADLLALLDALSIARARVAGHSMGSLVALHLAMLAPDRVRDLVLLGPIAEPPDAARTALTARAGLARSAGMAPIAETICERGLSRETRAERPLVTGFVRELLQRQDAEGYALNCLALATAPGAEPARVTCPVLLVSGDDDGTSPPAGVAALAAALPAARRVSLPGCGHWTALEKPDETVAAMRAFYGA
ncbi:MAG: alpha/beta fold hydrolase [Gammaproteobacteria bacterium]|nr:alpha/beta fold hydrolase [Gammaproteobacteria bacterium]